MKTFQLTLFSRFSLTSETRLVPLGDGSAHLLAYLALSRGHLVSRSRTAGALWPDLSETRARANLSTTIWRLRRALLDHGCPTDVIQASADSLGLNMASCDVDVDAFVRATVSPGSRGLSLDTLARAVNALDLYKGDLLEEWDVEWCRLEREELRTRYVHTLHALSEGFEQRGRSDLAMLYVRRAAQADPLNEAFQRSLMRLLYRTGDKASAVTEFNRFAHLAKSELGVEPDRETIALAREIRRPSSPSGSSDTLKPLVPMSIRPERIPLIGRDIERLELNALLETAVSARGGGVLLVGEAGIGKSKLADWVMEEWAARGGAAGRGRCIEFNDPVPYQPLLDALGGFVGGGDLAGFVSGDGHTITHFLDEKVGGTTDQPSDLEMLWPLGKIRLFAQLRSRLEDASRRRPLLAVIEDLQWADAGTVDFLAYLLERAKDMRLAVLLTSRPSRTGSRHRSHLDRLSRPCRATLRLGPLSMPETSRLVNSLLERGETPPSLARWVHAESEGNPLFVVETLRLLQRQGDLEAMAVQSSRGAGWSTTPDKGVTMPEAVRSTVEQRLALVDAALLRIAQIASVLGRSFEEDVLSMVVGARQSRLSQAVGQLLQEGIFEREGSAYRFSHDKIRAVCYESLPTRARRTYHARAAAALLRTPDVPIHRLAWHQYSAGQWNLATSSWEQAGDRARDVHAYEETLGAYGHAISCVQRDTTVDRDAKIHAEIGLLAKFDEVLAILGRPKERRDVLNQMGGLCDQSSRTSHRTVWLTRRAFLEEHLGNFGFAARLARRAWILARSDGDRSAETEALGILAWTLNRSGRRDRSLWVSRLALKRLGGVKSPLVVTLLCQVAGLHIRLSDYASAASYIERAKSISVELGLVTEHHLVIMMRAMLDKFTGDLEAAQSGMRSVLRFADEAGDAVTTARVTFQLSSMDAYAGRLGDALRRLRRATVASRSAGYGRTYLGCLNEVACGIGRLIGNYDWARKATDHFQRMAQTSGSRTLQAMLRDSQTQFLFETGRLDEAMTAICEGIRLYQLDGPSTGPYLEALARRGAIFLELGDYRAALADLEVARRDQLQIGDRLFAVDTLTQLALTYAKLGEADRALATSGDALRVLGELEYANMQPQRIFWHHYRILEMFGREPRAQYLKRAVEFIEAQAATLSKAQARRFKRDVRLNREILEAWERQQGLELTPGEAAVQRGSPGHSLAAAPATDPAYAPLVLSA